MSKLKRIRTRINKENLEKALKEGYITEELALEVIDTNGLYNPYTDTYINPSILPEISVTAKAPERTWTSEWTYNDPEFRLAREHRNIAALEVAKSTRDKMNQVGNAIGKTIIGGTSFTPLWFAAPIAKAGIAASEGDYSSAAKEAAVGLLAPYAIGKGLEKGYRVYLAYKGWLNGLNKGVAQAFSEFGQPVRTSSSITGRDFWIERPAARISEAERLGISKGERNQPQIDFSNRFHPAYTGKEAEDIFKSLYDPNIDGYSFQLRGDVAKARQIYKLSDNISDDVIGNVLEQRWRKILQYPEELTVQEVPEEIALKFLGKTPLELRAMGDGYNRGAESDVIIDPDFAYKFTRPAGSVSTLRSQVAHIMGKNGIGDFMIPNQYLGMVLKNGKYYGVFKQPTVLKVIDYDNFSDYSGLLERIPGLKDGKYTINHAVWLDIRPENIGIDNTGQVRVFDPGFVTNKMWEPHTMNGKSIFANDFRNPVNWQTGGLYEKNGGKLNYLNYIK